MASGQAADERPAAPETTMNRHSTADAGAEDATVAPQQTDSQPFEDPGTQDTPLPTHTDSVSASPPLPDEPVSEPSETDKDTAQTPEPVGASEPSDAAEDRGDDADRTGTERLDEHDSLVTVRLSEPPVLSVNTGNTAAPGTAATECDLVTPTTARSHRATMPTVVEDELDRGSDAGNSGNGSEDADDLEVNWEQLQQTEDEESHGQNADNTAMLLARLEQENAKLATNPKSVRVQTPDAMHESPRRVRPPSVAQLRGMVQGPTPAALRYSMLPPPPMTELEFYAALVQDYHQTAARLPTLLSNKIRKGIPPPLRGVVWQGMTGATRDTALGDQYERFCDATSPYEGIIGKDLGRSFPGVDMFRDPDGDGQRMLGRVLKSYSLHEPRIGYCQGLAFLVGPLLMHMADKEAFCVLVKLMENYDLRSSYMPDLAGLHVRIYQFRELLRATLPELSSHLNDLQVDPAAYVSQWFLSFFAVTCPLPMLFRMYDVVFAEGAAETIMRVALSLMQKNQARLLACAELEDAMQLLLSRGLWDCYHYNADEFVQHFHGLSSVVTRDRLASLDQAYREAQIANNSRADNGSSDRTSAITAIASRFLGRLWAPSSSVSSPSTAAAVPSPSASSPTPQPSASSSSPASFASPTGAASPASQPLAPSTGLSAPPLRPLSMLQRSSSKHSLASTVNSMDASSAAAGPSSSSVTVTSSSSSSVLSSTSTDATSLSRDSSSELNLSSKATGTSSLSGGLSNKNSDNDRYLHSQIEDLLTALGDLQRQHALVTDELQREREERHDDRKAVQALLQDLRARCSTRAAAEPSQPPVTIGVQLRETEADPLPAPGMVLSVSQEELLALFEPVEARWVSDADDRQLSVQQSKAQLSIELSRAKEQLSNELAKGQDQNRRLYEMEQEAATMKDQLRESHALARSLHQDKQRLERQIHDVRTRGASEAAQAAAAAAAGASGLDMAGNSAVAAAPGPGSSSAGHMASSAMGIADAATEWFGRATGTVASTNNGNSNSSGGSGSSSVSKSGGLRELKLGRSKSTPTQATKASPAAQQTLPNGTMSMNVAGGAVGGKRSSSLVVRGPGRRESVFGGASGLYASPHDSSATEQQQDALVLELVQAKTAEAVARQEAEEARQKLESLRKALGLSPSDMSSVLHNASGISGSASAAGTKTASGQHASQANPAATATATPAATTTAASSGGYGFFGWRR